jgi:uroporphyrinogen decarboxylase
MDNLLPRQRFVTALERRPLTGRVPHFELVFFLTMEAFGKVHPSQRHYEQWTQMEEKERQLHRRDMADIYIATAERFEHSAIFIHPNPDTVEETIRLVDILREKTGDRYFILRHGDATFSLPDSTHIQEFAYRIADEPEKVKTEAERMVDEAIRAAEIYARHGGLDGFGLCADYCFNTGPVLSPSMFAEFITPYLARLTRMYRDLGFYVIKHTDGNIMPILD